MKYRTVNGKIRHAVEPEGTKHSNTHADITCECGFHICSETGPCEPKPAPAKVPLHYHVFSAEVSEAFDKAAEGVFAPGWLYRSLMCYEPDQAAEPEKEEPSPFEGPVEVDTTKVDFVWLAPGWQYVSLNGTLTKNETKVPMKVRK